MSRQRCVTYVLRPHRVTQPDQLPCCAVLTGALCSAQPPGDSPHGLRRLRRVFAREPFWPLRGVITFTGVAELLSQS